MLLLGIVILRLFKQSPAIIHHQNYAKIAFVGDSHVQGQIGGDFFLPLGVILRNFNLYNFGHNGDSIGAILARIQKVIEANPSKIVVLGGSNNIMADVAGKSSLEEFKQDWLKLINLLAPRFELYVLTIPPFGDDLSDEYNHKVRQYNQFLRDICQRPRVHLLDLYARLTSQLQGNKSYERPIVSRALRVGVRRYILRQSLEEITRDYGYNLTVDGFHLNDKGASVVVQLLKDSLAK